MAKQAAKKPPEKRGMNADRKNGKAFKKNPKSPRKSGNSSGGYSSARVEEWRKAHTVDTLTSLSTSKWRACLKHRYASELD